MEEQPDVNLEIYKKDKKQFLGGLAILGADAFPFIEVWHNQPEGFIGNMSRLATLGALVYGSVKTTIGAQNTLIQRSINIHQKESV